MTLEEKINADIKSAMLAREAQKLEALRAIKSAVLLLKTSPEGLTEESGVKAMQKMVKQRKETAEIYTSQGRPELAEVELAQASIIEAYLPKQMGVATKQLAGKADGKIISQVVKDLLSK